MNRRKLLSTLALLAFISLSADATLIYEQGNINTSDRGAYQYYGQELADDFIAAATGSITNVTWTGSYYGQDNVNGIESFTFNLYDGGAAPGSLLYSFVGNALFSASSFQSYYDYSMDVSSLVLNAGTQYWVSIYSNDSPSNYAWAISNEGTANGELRNNGGAWRGFSGHVRSNHVFALNSVMDVPEPSTLAIFALSLMGLASRRFKKS